jgi:hypothetical protein
MRPNQTLSLFLVGGLAIACSTAKSGGGTGGTVSGGTGVQGGAVGTGGAGSGGTSASGGTAGSVPAGNGGRSSAETGGIGGTSPSKTGGSGGGTSPALSGGAAGGGTGGGIGSSICTTQKWTQTNWSADAKYFSLYAGQGGVFARVWDALNGGRTYLSSDDGANWAQVASADTDMDILSIVMLNNTALAGTWNEVLQSTSSGASFSVLTASGIPADTAIWSIAAIGTTVLAGSKEAVYRSSDNGSTWTEVKAGIPANAVVTSLVASGNSFVAGTDTAGVLTMPNTGTTWAAADSTLANARINQLAVLEKHLFAVTPDGVFVSSNDGASWTADTSGLRDVNCLLVVGGQLLAGTDNAGIQCSTDLGATWTSFGAGMPSATRVWSLASTGSSIFAGTSSGVWRVSCSN